MRPERERRDEGVASAVACVDGLRLDCRVVHDPRRSPSIRYDAGREFPLVLRRVRVREFGAGGVEHTRAHVRLAFDVTLEGVERLWAAALERLGRALRVGDHDALDELRRVRVVTRPRQMYRERKDPDDETHREPEPQEDF